jgi:hypothetical protein
MVKKIVEILTQILHFRKVAILLAIGDRKFTFGELYMKAECHLANKNYYY